MKQTIKRLLSTLLVLCMVLSILPVSAFAATDIGEGWTQVLATDAEAEAVTYSVNATGSQLVALCGTASGIGTTRYYYEADGNGEVQFQNNDTALSITFSETLHFYLTKGYITTTEGTTITREAVASSPIAAYATATASKTKLPNASPVYAVYKDAQTKADAEWYIGGSYVDFATKVAYKPYTPTAEPQPEAWVTVDNDGTLTPSDTSDDATAVTGGFSFTLPTLADRYDYVINTTDTTNYGTADGGTIITFTDSMRFRKNTDAIIYYYAVFADADGKVTDIVKTEKGVLPEFPTGTVAADWTYDATAISAVADGDVLKFIAPPVPTYTVSFYADGYLVAEDVLEEGDTITAPVVPEKTGYTGTWGTVAATMGTSNLRYDANYTAKEYEITFPTTVDVNGTQYNAGTYTSVIATYNDFIFLPDYNGEEPEGMKFIGWGGMDGAFYIPELETIYCYAGDSDLVPIFAADTEYWIVNFLGEGGSYGTTLVEQTTTAEVELPTYAPYPTAKWMNQATSTEYAAGDLVDITGNTAFVAQVPALCTVIFTNDGSVLSMQTLRAGEAPVAPAPAKEGYTLAGWSNGTTTYPPNAVPTAVANVTYTAVWEALEYNVTYEAADVTVSQETGTVIDQITVTILPHVGETYNYIYVTDEDDNAVPVTRSGENTYVFSMPASDVTITAVYAANIYRITFKDGLSIIDVQDVAHNTAPVGIAFVKTGYTLVGWWNDDTDSLYETDALPAATGNATYFAVWRAVKYDINVDEGDIVYPDKEKASVGEIVNVEIDEEYGYDTVYVMVFARNHMTGEFDVAVPVMHTEYDPIGNDFWQFTMPASDVLVLDGFTEHIYDVQFKDGENLLSHQSIAFESNAVEPAPTKEGYVLTGWVDEYNNFFEVGDLSDIEGDVIYTAVWEASEYDITVEDANVSADKTVANIGDIVTVTVTPVEGFDTYYLVVTKDGANEVVAVNRVDGSMNLPETKTYQFTMPAADVTVSWVRAEHIYDIQFKNGEDLVSHQEVPYLAVPAEPALVREGYTLIGWDDGTTVYAPGEVPAATADVIYTAVWEANLYNLTYYRGVEADESEYKCILELPDGDLVEFFNNDTINMPTYVVADIAYGEQVELGEAFLPGYVFLYWKDEDGHRWDAGEMFTMPAGGELLTAVWEEEAMENCLVRFMDDGELYDAYLAYVGATQYVPEIDPTEDGREFIGWEYDGFVYANDGVPEFEVIADENRDMVFTAVWSDDAFTVSFTGDAVDIAPLVDLPYGEEIVLPAAPEREGFTFVAWENVDNGALYGESAAYIVKHDATFTAVWSEDEIEYAVKFFDEKGNLVDVLVVPAGETITAPIYEQGREDCEYIWVDEAENLYYAEGEAIVVDDFLSFRATKIDEALYPVAVSIAPDTIATSVANIEQDEYFAGETVYVTINIPEGYVLKNVTAFGIGATDYLPVKTALMTYVPGEGHYFFEMPAAPVRVVVEFEEIPIGSSIVKFLSDDVLVDYRIVTRGSNGIAPETLPVKDGFTFLYWQSGTTIVEAGEPFAVAADAPDEIVFNAVWEQQSYMINYDAKGGVPQPASFDAVYNEQITLAAAPFLDGYKFIGWVEDSTGFIYGENATYTVKGAVSFTARWEIIPPEEYIVKFIDADTNQIFGYEIVEEGDTVIAPAGPSFSGLTFVAWEDAGGAQLLPGNLTQPIYADTVYVATYKVNTHSIYVATESCALQPNAFGAVEVGTPVNFTVNPIDRFTVTSVVISYMDGPALMVRTLTPDADGEYSFYMPDADVTVTAVAEQNVFSIFTNADENCIIDAQNYGAAGETVFFDVEVTNPDYELGDVYVLTTDDRIIPIIRINTFVGAAIYAFEMPAADVQIIATTVKTEYTVTYLDSDNTLLGIVPVDSGEFADAPEAIKDGYVFDGWEILPSKAEFDPATDAVTENLIVRATYIGEAFTVASGKIDNVAYLQAECTIHTGNLNSSNLLLTEILNAEAGETVYFTVAAKYDYVITDIAVVSAEGTDLVVAPVLREKSVEDNLVYYTYAFEMPAENVLIDIYTAPKFFKTSVIEDIPEGGEYTINGYYTSNLMILQGEEVVIAATPYEGFEIVNISGTYIDNLGNVAIIDGSFDGATFTYTMIAKDVEIIIDYEPIDYVIDIQTSNAETYKPDASQNPAVVIESLDEALTSKGRIDFVDGALIDFTNEAEQVYKIPANGEANIGDRIAFIITEYTGYDLDTLTVTYADGEKNCPLTFKDGVYYFDMPADDVVITATFVEETYKVWKDATSEAHGQVEMNSLIENSITADYKESIDVIVTPDDGYQIMSIYYVLADGTVLDFDAAEYNAAEVLTDAVDDQQFISFHMPASDVTVYVEYAPIAYSISDVCEEATATYTTPHTIGEQVSFETEANYGYIITAVYAINEFTNEKIALHTDSTNTLYGAEYFFTMPAAPVTIHVETIKDTYNVIYLDNGSFVGAEDVDYLDTADVAGHIADVVNGKPGYHFVGWTSADVQTPVTEASIDNADFVVIAKTIIRAAYEKDEIDVLFKATENGVVTENSTGNTAEYRLDTTVFGDKVTFTATPAVGYVIDTVTVTSTNAEGYNLDIRYAVNGNEYTFTIPATYKDNIHEIQAEDVIVTVTFKKDTFTLTRVQDCETDGTVAINGAVTTQTSFTYEYQDEVTITATPKDGYYVYGIAAMNADHSEEFIATGEKPETDTPVGDPLTLTFLMPADDLMYMVDYEKIDYSITTVFDATQGNVVTDPADIAQIDDLVTITVTPFIGYELVSLTVTYDDGESSLLLTEQDDGTFTFTMPAKPVTVTAIFTESAYTLTRADDCETDGSIAFNGAVTTQTSFTYDYKDEVIITATPKDGYYVASITAENADGTEKFTAAGEKPATDTAVGDALTLTFLMPHCDLTYTVDYEKIDYSITTVFDAEQGNVVTDPADIAQIDDLVTITVTPFVGYELVSLTVTYDNGESSLLLTEQDDGTFTFTMPAKAVTVTAIFTESTYTANLTVHGEADATLDGYYTYNMAAEYLDTVTINVEPALGWELVSITINDGAITVNEEIKPEGGDYTFTMPNEDVDIVVLLEKTGFGMTAYALNFYEDGHGEVTLTPEDVARVDDRIIIVANPDDGYRVKEVVVLDENGYAVPVSFVSGTPGYEETYYFTMPAFDVEIFVYFEVYGSSYYTDVRTDFWFFDAVTFVTDRGYFKGITPELFAPYMNMDRAMFVTVLGRISEIDTSAYTAASPFTDVDADAYYAPYIAWAAENDIVLGRDATTFDPHASITREEMAAIMYRYCKYLGADMTLENQMFMDRYEDVGDISPWAEEYVCWAVGVGLMRGMSPTTIDPLDYASRAQVAQIVKNLCDKVFYQ